MEKDQLGLVELSLDELRQIGGGGGADENGYVPTPPPPPPIP